MKPNINPTKIEHLLTRRVEKIYPSKEALKKVLLSGKKLRLYQGFDPSTPNLHIGHLVGLLKLKEFQQMGHEVIFLIGDFTGIIGDPTGKIEGARPQLTREQVLENAKTYKKQAGMILNFSGKNPVKLKYNSQWLTKLSLLEAARLTRLLTYAQVIKRDMFQQRLKEDKDIFLTEFFYPFFQAYDSVYMDVDLEIGGSDQMFNMMVGRDLMHKIKKKEKFVLTTKLLVDSTGKKIGKTEGNVVNIANLPYDFFGQIMSLSDEAILPCFELITEIPLSGTLPAGPAEGRMPPQAARQGCVPSKTFTFPSIKKALATGQNPMEYKKLLAFELTKMLNGNQAAQKAQKEFEKVHQSRGLPSKIPTFPLKNLTKNPINVLDLLLETKLASSKSEAKRLIIQGAVEINGKRVLELKSFRVLGKEIIKVGKRKFLKIV